MLSFLQALFLLGSIAGALWLYPRPKYPPGPTSSWILRNLLQIPSENQWFGFSKLPETYRPCMHLRILSQHIIVLSTINAARDLLEK
ncbi:hypothetical protein GYMLUDRAFT_170284 [Collybiopsis luxurians FD-317 M1]|uniref:Cytochrome P450 n=1 Tax=Collybiopsis luxurians FD-317 M1 TaxID=944289 RepID=A0A0D0CT18_9AGAR|nr:hypothetical protein GYMLUDRAFT_170284 [Collybiopsis luxurians FD-317 M1]